MENVYRVANGGEGVGGLAEVKGLREVVWEVAVRANDELMTARRELELGDQGGGIPIEKALMPVFLAVVSVCCSLRFGEERRRKLTLPSDASFFVNSISKDPSSVLPRTPGKTGRRCF